jgi:mevalonate pyrophosphate decarboxylase
MGMMKRYMMMTEREKKALHQQWKENEKMDKEEYKYITSAKDSKEPFYPGLMRDADR